MATRALDDGTTGLVTIRDYQHAARIFNDGNYRLSPKYGFLFYVEFDFDPNVTNISNTTAQEMGMIVKSVNLPKYTIQVKEHNAYNRKNYVQNSIKYDPVTITFHDDQSDNVLSFWYDYYSYYYRDSDYATSTYSAPHKYQRRASFDWGYTPRPAPGYVDAGAQQPYQYIQSIRIYSMFQGQFDEYQLINPIITGFKHGDHQQGNEGGTLQHEMNVQFETVKYLSGYVTPNTAGGYIDLHYDTTPSPLVSATFVPGANRPSTPNDRTSNYTPPTPTASNPSTPSASAGPNSTVPGFRNAVTTSSKTPANAGGFSIPSFSSLGSLNQGVPTSAQIANQLNAAGINLVGSATSTIATGIVSGAAKGLGPNGGAIINLAAQTLTNPSAVLKTGLNIGTQVVTGMAYNAINTQVEKFASAASTAAQNELNQLNLSVGQVFGDPGQTFTSEVASAFDSLKTSVTDFFDGLTS